MKKIFATILSILLSASLLLAMPVFAVDELSENKEVSAYDQHNEAAVVSGPEIDTVETYTEVLPEGSEEETSAVQTGEKEETQENEVSQDEAEEETEDQQADAAEDLIETETEVSAEDTDEETEEEPVEFEETEVEVVHSIEELISNTQAADNESFITIDAATGDVDGELTFEDLCDAEYDEVVSDATSDSECVEVVSDYIRESDLYSVENIEGTSIEIVSVFSNQRLILRAEEDTSLQAYGAYKAVYFKDSYTLQYNSEEETQIAYERLIEDFGRDTVLIDFPVKAETNGWGVDYMNFETPKFQTDKYAGNVTIAVVDTGVDMQHEVFKNIKFQDALNVLADPDSDENYYDPTSAIDDVKDEAGHGTAVAGIIAESVPSNISIMPIKVQSRNDNGSLWNMVLGAMRADKKGADIINMSLGTGLMEPDEDGEPVDKNKAERFFKLVEGYLRDIDAMIIAASGNLGYDQDEMLFVPASIDKVVSVGAIYQPAGVEDKSDYQWYSSSNFGKSLDFVAPGKNIQCAIASSGSRFGSKNGTSLAAPYISSVAAIIKSSDTTLSNEQIIEKMKEMSLDLGAPGRDDYCGYGCPVFEKIPVKEIKLEKSSLTIEASKTDNIKATVLPENASIKGLSYSCSNTAVATVDANGKVTAKKAGTANITVSAKDGSGVTAVCKITVKEPATQPTTKQEETTAKQQETTKQQTTTEQQETTKQQTTTKQQETTKQQTTTKQQETTKQQTTTKAADTSIQKITLNKTSVTLATQSTIKLSAKVTPSNSKDKLVWSSSDKTIATVDQYGNVKALRYGKVKITVSNASGTKKAVCTVQTRYYDVNNTSMYYYKPVYWAADKNITRGYDNVYFGPQRTCTRREMVIFLWRYMGRPSASGSIGFSDTKYSKNSDTYKAILWASKKGIIKGYDDGTFRPDATVIRKDAMIMLYRLIGKPDVSGRVPFADVNAMGLSQKSDTYRAILWGNALGITRGYSDGSFKPKANCLREHIITFLYRLKK